MDESYFFRVPKASNFAEGSQFWPKDSTFCYVGPKIRYVVVISFYSSSKIRSDHYLKPNLGPMFLPKMIANILRHQTM